MPHATIKSMQNQNSIALYEISIITHSFVTKLLVYAYNIDVSSITYEQLCELRLEMGSQLGLRDKNNYSCLWVVDFPLSSSSFQ